jgi:putative ABC transport system ATP-binding protein
MSDGNFLTLENVTKAYLEGGQERLVLKDASANFERGELVSIVGRSGSGKSTLLNLISGIDRVNSGHIYMEGVQLTTLDDQQRTLFRRRNIGFVFQFFNLIPTLTVQENVSLPLELNSLTQSEARSKSAEMLSSVGLGDRLDTFPDRLSGGEQQRVAIARALVHDPLLVLADEPTGNLDEDTGVQILDLLDRLTRQAGKNLIMVTHSRDAAAIADRILCLREGELTLQCDP